MRPWLVVGGLLNEAFLEVAQNSLFWAVVIQYEAYSLFYDT